MKGNSYTILYAVVMGVVCAVLLTGASEVLGPYKEANRKAEEMRNILQVLGVPVPEGASSRRLVEIYERNIRTVTLGELPAYRYVPADDPGGNVKAVAVPFSGPGLWGPIKGLLALDPSLQTVRGIAFYEQEETPGLGAEIAGADFRGQFVGKGLQYPDGRPGMLIKTGAKDASNGVDAISGATMTCDKVQAMLSDVIAKIVRARGTHG